MSEEELWNLFLTNVLSAYRLWCDEYRFISYNDEAAARYGASEAQRFFIRNVCFQDIFPAYFELEKEDSFEINDEFKTPNWQYLIDEKVVREDGTDTVLAAMCKRWPEYNVIRVMYV